MALICTTLTTVCTTRVSAQQNADVIRGRVIGQDSAPILGAQVVAISYGGGIEKRSRSDRNGRFALVFPNGEGNYWVVFNAIGFVQRRIQVRRRGDEEVLIADVRLSKTQELQAVNVNATAVRENVPRGDNNQDVSGTDQGLSKTAVTPNDAGNLAALAASSPGIQLIPGIDGHPDRFSIFGLPADQNTTTLNGLVTSISRLPRDANTSLQIRSGYDIANGGASGATIAINTLSGTNTISRTFSGLVDPVQAQWNDRVGQAAEYGSVSLGGRVSGPWSLDRTFYSLAFQVDRQSQDVTSIADATPAIYESAGVDPDAIVRLRAILVDLGIPLSAPGTRSSSRRTSAAALGTVSWAPRSAASGHALALTFNGAFTDNGPPAFSPLGTGASLVASRSANGSLLLRHTNYFGSGTLTETALSAATSDAGSTPLVALPSGRVLVTSLMDDGSRSARALSFGGGANASRSSTTSLGARNILSRFSEDNRHRFKLISEVRLEHETFLQRTNLRGRFTFESLDALASGDASSYTRTLNAVGRSSAALVGAIGVGDSWRPNPDLQIQYGVRVDGNQMLARPAANTRLVTLLGVTNTHLPNRVYVSPRLGFSYAFGGDAVIPLQGGEVGFGAPTVVRGGIGLFQNVRGADLASSVYVNTGLPSDVRQIQCSGSATPGADWNVLSTDGGFGPSECARDANIDAFATTAPAVSLFSQSYVQPRSLRTSLNWASSVLGNRYFFTGTATYALNLNQPDVLDRNFHAQPQFTLGAEGMRAVFVRPSQIDASSGLIAPGGARISPEFGIVSELQSSLRSRTGQVAVYFQPNVPSRFWYQLQYSYLNTQQQYRGFARSAGDPRQVQWGRGVQPRHDFGLTLRYKVSNIANFSLLTRITSGMRYTPMVANDIDGDGIRNDPAFIFAPGEVGTDVTLASDMQGLLTQGSRGARECLRSQLGQVAGRHSCAGPWTLGNSSLGVALNSFRLGLPASTTVSLVLSNPLAAADLVLHGANRLRGWGQAPATDESLLYVRGFDTARERYAYAVNQRFGATRTNTNLSRAPIVLTLKVTVDLSPTPDWQFLYQGLERGRSRAGTKMSEGALRQLAATMFRDPLGNLLDRAEQVQLTRVQADSTARMSRRYKRLIDSLWTPAAKAYAALPATYDHAAAESRLVAARDAVFGYLIHVMPHVESMLTKGQRVVLSSLVGAYFDTAFLQSLRRGTPFLLTTSTPP